MGLECCISSFRNLLGINGGLIGSIIMIRRKLVTVVCYTALGFSFAISVYVAERFFALAVKLDNMSVALVNLEKPCKNVNSRIH
jgi:hypothetical protein